MLGLGSRNGREAGVSRGRTIVSRLLAGGAAVLLLVSAGGCGAPGGQPSGTPTRTPGAISVPTGQQEAWVQCMIDAGWQISAVHSNGPGKPTGYEFTDPGATGAAAFQAIQERSAKCKAMRPTPATMSDAEIRDTYNLWVGEYQCLVGLKYQPDPPPSFETFLASWDTGPWMPINHVDTGSWNQAQYDEAKAKCTLEFFSDDRY